jgi:primosomal protein N' (replication factor Y)
MGPQFVDVAIDVPLSSTFTWTWGAHTPAPAGARVMVPWSSGVRMGIVIRSHDEQPTGAHTVRAVAEVIDTDAFIPAPQLQLALWTARYYAAPVGECVRLTLPAGALVTADASVHACPVPAREEPAWVGLLREHGPMTMANLRSRFDLRHTAVCAQERAGAIRIDASGARQQVSEKTALEFERTTQPISGRIGPAARRALDYLEQFGASMQDELAQNVEVSRTTLRTLEERGLVTSRALRVYRNPLDAVHSTLRSEAPELGEAQAAAVAMCLQQLESGTPTPVLLHGVTGSGKTEVYVRLADFALRQGRQVLVLLPEIALTPQFVGVFRSVFGDRVAVQHSGMTQAQRYDQWQRIRFGGVDIVIGARSALFAPLERLGLLVVDEEHDPSFKQDTGVPYHARDLAVVLARDAGAALVLGSATPSLESWANADRGRYQLASLPTRVMDRPQPRIELISMEEMTTAAHDDVSRIVSPRLQREVMDNTRQGEQTILFLNRRGFSPVVHCTTCETRLSCPDCNVTLTYHQRGHRLRCHWCGFNMVRPSECPTCGASTLETDGVGTEQLENVIEKAFEGVRVLRLDADTSKARGVASVLERFRAREADVLVGTQMVTKGHDFPAVTLVGVINADQTLKFPDFRSGERTFQLLTQVAGRAGRATRPGRVLIQTWDPSHFVLQAVVRGDLDGWKKVEFQYRKANAYPPFGSMVLLRCTGPDAGATMDWAQNLVRQARSVTPRDGLRWVGPVEAPIARLRGQFRVHVLVRSADRAQVRQAIAALDAAILEHGNALRSARVRADLDVDPQSLL